MYTIILNRIVHKKLYASDVLRTDTVEMLINLNELLQVTLHFNLCWMNFALPVTSRSNLIFDISLIEAQ